MNNPHDLCRAVIASTGDGIAAIRAIRERFGLDPRAAEEVILRVEGTASLLDEHEAKRAQGLGRDVDRYGQWQVTRLLR